MIFTTFATYLLRLNEFIVLTESSVVSYAFANLFLSALAVRLCSIDRFAKSSIIV